MVSFPFRTRVFSPTRPYTRLNHYRRKPCPHLKSSTLSLRWHTRPRSRTRDPKGLSQQWKNQRRFWIRTSTTHQLLPLTYALGFGRWVSVHQNLRRFVDHSLYIFYIDEYSHRRSTVIRIAIVISTHSQSYILRNNMVLQFSVYRQ
jgi:hypothetical protein